MIDLHCHLLPYVDDGAHDLEEAEALLTLEAEQGVAELCLTPHLRAGMFETPDEKVQGQFARLKTLAAGKGIRLYLSREYHWDELFEEKLRAGEVLPMGQNVLLTEFSPRHSPQQMLAAAEEIRGYGYTPLIAHAERYPAADAALIGALKKEGALIQINADAVLGYDGRWFKRLAWELLKADLVDAVASDAHSTGERPPRMAECAALIRKKLGPARAEKLLLRGPEAILTIHNTPETEP